MNKDGNTSDLTRRLKRSMRHADNIKKSVRDKYFPDHDYPQQLEKFFRELLKDPKELNDLYKIIYPFRGNCLFDEKEIVKIVKEIPEFIASLIKIGVSKVLTLSSYRGFSGKVPVQLSIDNIIESTEIIRDSENYYYALKNSGFDDNYIKESLLSSLRTIKISAPRYDIIGNLQAIHNAIVLEVSGTRKIAIERSLFASQNDPVKRKVLQQITYPIVNNLQILDQIPCTNEVISNINKLKTRSMENSLSPGLASHLIQEQKVKYLPSEKELTNDEVETLKKFSEKPYGIISRSRAIAKSLELLAAYKDDVTLLLTGERGVGKGLFVRAIHRISNRSDKKLVEVNCASVEPQLLASELFGSKRGAYTGADRDRNGLIQAAGEGTLFLDEIGRIPKEAQGNLLRALEEGEFTPIGGTVPEKVRARIIVASNQDLEVEVEEGRFHADLLDRVNRAHIHVPSLAERIQDIPLLAKHFYDTILFEREKVSFVHDKLKAIINEKDFLPLCEMDFPGNVRELRNKIEGFILRNFKFLEELHPSMILKLVSDDSVSIKTLISNPVFHDDYPIKREHWIAFRGLLENGFNQTQATKYSEERGGPKDKVSVLKYSDTLLLVIANEAEFQTDQMIDLLKDRGIFSGDKKTCRSGIDNRLRYLLSKHNKGSKKVISPWANGFLAELREQRPDLI